MSSIHIRIVRLHIVFVCVVHVCGILIKIILCIFRHGIHFTLCHIYVVFLYSILIFPFHICHTSLPEQIKKAYQGGVEPPVMAPEAIAVSDWLLVHSWYNTTKV